MTKIKAFIKDEFVLVISAVIAVLTMFFVPPDKEYIEYIDFRVLCLLLCLMAVVAAFRKSGVFDIFTYELLKKVKKGSSLGICLVMLPFFSSMLITNDVALIIFVPFTVTLMLQLGFKKQIIPILVLQTVGANLGSTATPIGNPQNLFLYSEYNLSASSFFSVTVPIVAVSFVLLIITSFFVLPKDFSKPELEKVKNNSKDKLIIYILLFLLCILTVFKIIPYALTAVIVVSVFLMVDRKIFKEVDFMLLLTFVCFFIISENLGRTESVRMFLGELLSKNTLLTSIGASQVISNVPAAVLLSGFTDNCKDLLSGVNIGGLGTPVASLASLITLKLYLKTHDSKPVNFLLWFMGVNIAGLVLLTAFAMIF